MNQPAKNPAERTWLDEAITNTAAQAETLQEMAMHKAALAGGQVKEMYKDAKTAFTGQPHLDKDPITEFGSQDAEIKKQ
eukprot:403369090